MVKKAKQKQLDPTMPVYQVKITLRGVKRLIWRRVQMDDCFLDELHDIIQISMGWEDEHAYAFIIERELYGDLESGDEFEHDVQSVRLSDLVKRGTTSFCYDYDFGDDWRHTIDIEKTLPAEEGVYYPRCVMGELACPPEGCGGPFGYARFLDGLQNPDHDGHQDARERVGGAFDPEAADLDQTNKELGRLRRFLDHCKGTHAAEAADAPNDRIRMVFGLTTDDPLPPLDTPHQRKFLDYLRANLAFPFQADCAAAAVGEPDTGEAVTVLGFADPPIDSKDGIICEARRGHSGLQVPLSDIQVIDDVPNFQYVEDYTYWLWEGDECDEDEQYGHDADGLDEEPDDEEHTRGNAIPVPKERMEVLSARREKVFASAGWNPAPGGNSFFDALPLEHVEHVIAQAMRRVGVAPAFIHAFEKTGLIVTADNQHLFEPTELEQWNAAIKEFRTKRCQPEELQFPAGTIAYYGPDDMTTTKIVAAVIEEQGAEAIIRRWIATDVLTSPRIQREIVRFFQTHGVEWFSTSDGNMGCVHEEGEDFPVGGDCPFCPWWKKRQGSGLRK